MKLIPDNGCYKLQVNGQDIKFQKVSTGEAKEESLVSAISSLIYQKDVRLVTNMSMNALFALMILFQVLIKKMLLV